MQQDQTVQWFPGHMARTRRQIRECLPLVDAVTELLDARIPESSKNPELSALIGNKPRIVLLNKCDLADAQTTKQWLSHFEAMGAGALAVDCRSGKGLNAYHGLVRNILADKIREYRDDEDALKDALLLAQKQGNQIINDSKAAAEKLRL